MLLFQYVLMLRRESFIPKKLDFVDAKGLFDRSLIEKRWAVPQCSISCLLYFPSVTSYSQRWNLAYNIELLSLFLSELELATSTQQTFRCGVNTRVLFPSWLFCSFSARFKFCSCFGFVFFAQILNIAYSNKAKWMYYTSFLRIWLHVKKNKIKKNQRYGDKTW